MFAHGIIRSSGLSGEPDVSNGKVDFGAKVPQELVEEFHAHLPIYGATVWFLTESLAEFNTLLRNDPSLRKHVSEAVERMVAKTRAAG